MCLSSGCGTTAIPVLYTVFVRAIWAAQGSDEKKTLSISEQLLRVVFNFLWADFFTKTL